MSKLRLVAVAFAVACCVGALSSSSASAEWMLNGKTLVEEGLTSATLVTTAKVDKSIVLSSAGLTIECTGNPETTKPEILSTLLMVFRSIWDACVALIPVACTVPTTIGTVPVLGEPTLDGSLAVKGIIKPEAGKVFTTIAVTGPECAAAGNKPVTGDYELLFPEGQDERTDQLVNLKQGSTGLLKLGSESASLSGSYLWLMINRAAWSYL